MDVGPALDCHCQDAEDIFVTREDLAVCSDCRNGQRLDSNLNIFSFWGFS